MQITIDFEDLRDLKGKVDKLRSDIWYGVEDRAVDPTLDKPIITYSSTPKSVAEVSPLAATGTKRGPKPKVKPEPVQTDIEEVTAAKTPTYDEVVDALKKYMGKEIDGAPAGIAGVRKFLVENFSVEQTKAIKPEDFARVIELAAA